VEPFVVYAFGIGSELKCLMASNDGVVLSWSQSRWYRSRFITENCCLRWTCKYVLFYFDTNTFIHVLPTYRVCRKMVY